MDFGASPREHIGETLFQLDELDLVETAVDSRNTPFEDLLGRLGIDYSRCWMAVNIPTNKLIGVNIQEKLRQKLGGDPGQKIAGDIDLIAGEIRNGDLCFDRLGALQIKKRGVEATDRLARFSSGFGTGQASFTALMGFDWTMLLHFFVRDPKPVAGEYAPSWNPMINTDFIRVVRASYGTVRDRLKRELYGYGWLGWGQAFGREAYECGGLASDIIIEPPFRPKMDDSDVCFSREALTKSLIELLSSELKRQGGLRSLPFTFKWPRRK